MISFLFPLTKFKIDNIKKVVLLGIGNNGSNNIDYVNKRLRNICKQGTGIDYDSFYDWSFRGNIRKKIQLDYYNLNGTGYCQYSDLMPATVGDINFHPRYEGKCINYLQEHKVLTDAYWKPSTLFWVVGSDIQP